MNSIQMYNQQSHSIKGIDFIDFLIKTFFNRYQTITKIQTYWLQKNLTKFKKKVHISFPKIQGLSEKPPAIVNITRVVYMTSM